MVKQSRRRHQAVANKSECEVHVLRMMLSSLAGVEVLPALTERMSGTARKYVNRHMLKRSQAPSACVWRLSPERAQLLVSNIFLSLPKAFPRHQKSLGFLLPPSNRDWKAEVFR